MASHPASLWLENNWSQLPPGCWVAAVAGRLVAENSDYGMLLFYVDRSGAARVDVAIAYVPRLDEALQ